MAQADPYQLLDRAVNAARAGADLAARHRAEGIGPVDTKSTATDVVTAADRAVEELLRGLLVEGHPGDRLLGEEGGETGGGAGGVAGDPASSGPAGADDTRWIVDPIDGTVNFVYGLPHYAVSIAAEVAGQVVAGVVLNAATGEEWTAVRGGGAWHAGARLTGSPVTRLDQCLTATGFGYDSARRAHQATVLTAVLPRVRDIRRLGAAALDLCAAAQGRVDVYFEKGLNPWDHAAGGLVATEAGLVVSGLRGAPPGPLMVLAAPPAVHGPMHDLLVQFDADGGP